MSIVQQGQLEASIETPASGFIRLFYKDSTNQYGYKDSAGVFHYFSEGVTAREEVEDVLANSFQDSSSISWTYNDAGNYFEASVIEGGIDHDQLLNFVANEHIDWTQAGAGTIHPTNYVDNDTIYTHPNHSGEVTSTGDGAQVLDKTAISNKTQVTAATDDYVLIGDTSDTGNLKKVTAQSIADLSSNGLETKSNSVAGTSFTPVSGSRVYDVVFSTAFADANYSISISSSIARTWTWESKTASGFRLQANSNSALTGVTVDWVATKHGES